MLGGRRRGGDDDPHPTIEEVDEAQQAVEAPAQVPELAGVAGELLRRIDARQLGAARDDGDDWIRLSFLARLGDTVEPLPVVPDHEVRGRGRTPSPGSPRIRGSLDQPPLRALGERQGGGAV